MPVARSSTAPSAVRAYGRLWPAFAKRKRPDAGSITP